MASDRSLPPVSRSLTLSDMLGRDMRRYVIRGLAATAWCCLWIMVGLIVGMP